MKQQKLKLLARVLMVSLAVIMIVTCMSVNVQGATYSMTDVASEQTLTSGDIVTIGTVEELYAFAAYINAGNSGNGITFKLTSDLLLNDLSDVAAWSEGYAPKNVWEPISTFYGTFDGDGHTISGLYCFKKGNVAGLFGRLNEATIQNLNLGRGLVISLSNAKTGSIAGGVQSSRIINCHNACTVRGTQWVGGIAGEVLGSSTVITDCSNVATITATTGLCGGIAGRANNTTVTSCVNAGTIHSGSDSGGITGSFQGSHSLSNCYNMGTVEGTSNIGGIVGQSSCSSYMIANCCNVGPVSGYVKIGGIAGWNNTSVSCCYYLEGTAPAANGYDASTSLIDTFDASGMLTSANNTGIIAGTTTIIDQLNAASWATKSWTGSGGYPILIPGLVAGTKIWDGTAATGFAGGTGTEADPYRIETAEQLKYFAD